MRTIVAKFGGSSLANAEQFKKVKAIILSNPERRIIIASAPGKRNPDDKKVTDLLISCYLMAANHLPFEEELKEIESRFREIVSELELDFPLEEQIEEIRNHLCISPDRQFMESRGEFLNSQLLASYLEFDFVDPKQCVLFSKDGVFDSELTNQLISEKLKSLKNVVVAGFYGSDHNGNIHTFSRGGSDITGSIVARAVSADLYENWTDVSGVFAADPEIVKNPQKISYLTYQELQTFSYMGATVLHTDAVLPVSRSGIPINIRNTNLPEEKGTMIVKNISPGHRRSEIIGVAGRTGMTIIMIEKQMLFNRNEPNELLMNIFERHHFPYEYYLTGNTTISVVIRNDLLNPVKEEIISEIYKRFQPDMISVKENLSMIAVIGEPCIRKSQIVLDILTALSHANIDISTINQGIGNLNLLLGIREEHYEEAIRVIYSLTEND